MSNSNTTSVSLSNRHVKILSDFAKRLDFSRVRLRKPHRFIFLCGGKIAHKEENSGSSGDGYKSFRDYILRRPVVASVSYALAENAIGALQYSGFQNLIDLEKHIAELSELIVVITESPGSFAELGAFSEIGVFREKLFVIVPDVFYRAQSFIALGPIKSLHDQDEDRTASFRWVDDGDVRIDEGVNGPADIAAAFNSRIKPQDTYLFNIDSKSHQMLLIYWASIMLRGITIPECDEFLREIGFKIPRDAIKQHLHCMLACEWMEFVTVGREIFVPLYDSDPVKYAFKEAKKEHRGDAGTVRTKILQVIESEHKRNKLALSYFGRNTIEGEGLSEIELVEDIGNE